MAFDFLGLGSIGQFIDPEERGKGIAREQASSELSSLFGLQQFLNQASAEDTAPSIEAETVQSPVNFLSALGAAGMNVFRPGTLDALAQRQQRAQLANAQLEQQAELANQVQEGYLQRRKQERQQLLARLQAQGDEVRAKLKARLDELGLQGDEREAAARAASSKAAGQFQKDIDKAEADWMRNFGQMVFGDLAQLEFGQEIVQGQPTGQPLDPRMAEIMKSNLLTLIRSLPDGSDMRQDLLDRLNAIESREESAQEAVEATKTNRGFKFPTDKEAAEFLGRAFRQPEFTEARRLGVSQDEKFNEAITAPSDLLSDVDLFDDLEIISQFLNNTDVPTQDTFESLGGAALFESLRNRKSEQDNLLDLIGGTAKRR